MMSSTGTEECSYDSNTNNEPEGKMKLSEPPEAGTSKKVTMDSNNSDEDALYAEVGNFILKNDKLHDVQFIVGEEKEKMKAVKLLLINQSRTWWSMLSEDSPLAEKGDISLPDIEPEIFKLLVKHSYGGLDKLDDLSDDVVVKLCYCANKYFMKTLMTKIAARLEPKDVDGVFPALHCLAYYNLHGVEDGVKKIVQTQTKQIFEHSEFLECDVESITFICKQDMLSCDELTLWNAVVTWAKHKAQGGEGAQLRQWMSLPLQHIRLLTLSEQDLFQHVFPTCILTNEEVAFSSLNKISHQMVKTECSLSHETSARSYFVKEISNIVLSVDIIQGGPDSNEAFEFKRDSCSYFLVKEKGIELQSISIRGYSYARYFANCRGSFYNSQTSVNVGIIITKITDLLRNTSSNKPVILNVQSLKHFYFDRVSIPTLIANKGINLEANSKYKVQMSFDYCDMPCYVGPRSSLSQDFDHSTFFYSWETQNGINKTPCHIIQFTYSVAD